MRSAVARDLAHRCGSVVVTIVDADGAPFGDRLVHAEQKSHEFSFGNIGFDFVALANRDVEPADAAFGAASPDRLDDLAALWLDLFNTATLPFYWRGFEPRPGHTDTRRLLTTARWFAERGVAVKGHPLAWHTLAPPWLDALELDEVERQQRLRIRREVSDFAGLIDTWDAINETVIMPVFDKDDNAITRLARDRGRLPMIRLAFEEARAANPSATLLINDFDLSVAYECLIEAVLDSGIQVDAIGLQTHMHQGYWGEDAMLEMIDRFARFGLPLHLTESTILSGEIMPGHIVDLNDYQVSSWPSTPEGEDRQADEIERHYRSLLSHPAVAAVNYWGLTDDGAWLGAPVGLVRADGSRKPSYDALHSLIKGEWWMSPTTLRTDRHGRVTISGFAGEYALSTRSGSAPLVIRAGETTNLTVTL